MGDVLRNILMLTWMACAFNSNAVAADNNFSVEEALPINSLQPTVVWGEAKTAKGGDNQVIIEQPYNSGNHRNGNHRWNKYTGHFICNFCNWRFRCRSFLHHLNNLSQRCILTNSCRTTL